MLCGSFVNTTCLEWCARTSVDLRTFTRAYPLVHLELHVRCDDDLVFRRPRQVVAQFVLLKIVRIDDHSGHAWFPAARGRIAEDNLKAMVTGTGSGRSSSRA
jgi:hypothetical protein